MKNKIALVIPWYGPFPWYWKFFVHSMRYNPSVDCILITDELQEEILPPNIKIFRKSLSDIKDLAERKLGFKVSLDYPYKLCDFKPTYGLIFEDLLTEYDFWGYGDIDLIFGNIRNFITDEILRNYDLISVRRSYLTGFFLLFRNSDYMNRLFMKSKDYRMVYESSQCWCFDECNYMHTEIEHNKKNIWETEYDIESMEHVVQEELRMGRIRTLFDLMVLEGTSGDIKWEDGILTYKNKYEILLYHFIALKHIKRIYIPNWDSIPNAIYFGSNYISNLPDKKGYYLRRMLHVVVDKLIYSINYFFRVNILNRFYSSSTIKSSKLKQANYIGRYRMGSSSILYTLSIEENKLFIKTKNSSTPLLHIWKNKFITSDGKTILRGREKGECFYFEIDYMDSKSELLMKITE